MQENPLSKLPKYGQSVWLDYIRRSLIVSGELRSMIKADGIMGMTSNPAIFEKAILDSHDYDDEIQSLVSLHESPKAIYEILSVRDVQMAADEFRQLYDQTEGRDGFVSLEVSPHLAHDTKGTIEEARNLWDELRRPNVMIKVPGTSEGLLAIRQLISEGINVNVTLLFSVPRYRKVAEAFVSGLESRAAQGGSLSQVASVASFFVSRIDSLIDPLLEKIASTTSVNAESARGLQGQIAIASAKLAYSVYKEIFEGERFAKLAAKGARAQRLLWASTSTKNPKFSDVKYVEALIAANTVNTMPLETVNAYRDHGNPEARLIEDLAAAGGTFDKLAALGVKIDELTQQLENEGVQKFEQSFDNLLKVLELRISKPK